MPRTYYTTPAEADEARRALVTQADETWAFLMGDRRFEDVRFRHPQKVGGYGPRPLPISGINQSMTGSAANMCVIR